MYAVWMAPQARGLSVGVLRAVGSHAAATGIRHLLLDVGDHNEPALRLHQRLGFMPTGRRSAFPPLRRHITEQELVLEVIPWC